MTNPTSAPSTAAVLVASTRAGSGRKWDSTQAVSLASACQAGEVRLGDPQAAQQRRGHRDGRAVLPGRARSAAPAAGCPARPGSRRRPASPRRGPAPATAAPKSRAQPRKRSMTRVGLAGLLPAGGAELAHRLQHPEARARPAVGHPQQRLVDQLLQDGVVAEHVARGGRGEPAGEHRQRTHRRLPGGLQEMPAPVDDGVQRVVPFRRVPRAAPQQREPVVQPPGDLGDRHHPHPCRRQLHGERQPVQAGAQLPHHARRQVDVGADRPRTLAEQLDHRRQVQLGQRVHRLRGEAERGAAGGEHPQLLARGHQRPAPARRRRVPRARSCPAPATRGRGPGRRRCGRRIRPVGCRPGARPASGTPRADATSPTTSPSAVTPASPTKCTTRCSACRATACASRVLPRPPAPTIEVTRDVPSRSATAATSLSRPSIGLGSCRTPCRTTGASLSSSSRCTLLQRGAGIAAQLLAQGPPVGVVAGQSRGRAHRGGLAAQQLRQDLLVPGAFGGQRGSGSTASVARPSRDSASARARVRDRYAGTPRRAQRGQRVVARVGVPARRAFAQRETGLGVLERGGVFAGAGAALARGRARSTAEASTWSSPSAEPVAGRRAEDDVRAEPRAGAGHQDLQRLGGVLGSLVRPQRVDQPGGAAARAQVAGQQREQAARPGAGDLHAAVGHPRQQNQLDRHSRESNESAQAAKPSTAAVRSSPVSGRWRSLTSRARAGSACCWLARATAAKSWSGTSSMAAR